MKTQNGNIANNENLENGKWRMDNLDKQNMENGKWKHEQMENGNIENMETFLKMRKYGKMGR